MKEEEEIRCEVMKQNFRYSMIVLAVTNNSYIIKMVKEHFIQYMFTLLLL